MPLQLSRSPGDLRRNIDANLRTGIEPFSKRAHVRGDLGPQAYRHAHFAFDDFIRPSSDQGVVRTTYGQRVLFASGAILSAMTETLVKSAGPQAIESLYQTGRKWGAANFDLCAARLEQEYGIPHSEMDIGLVLESWWWPLRSCGWGRWHCDLNRRQAGLIVIDVHHSASAAALGRTGYCECHLYSGLFSGAFSRLADRSLDGVEIACVSRGDSTCRFVIASKERSALTRAWRDDGLAASEILRRLTEGGNAR